MLSTVLIVSVSCSVGFVLGAVWHGINSVPFPPPRTETPRLRRVPDHLPKDLE